MEFVKYSKDTSDGNNDQYNHVNFFRVSVKVVINSIAKIVGSNYLKICNLELQYGE